MRLPYGIYKAAQAEALRQKQARAIEQAQSLVDNSTANLAMAKEAISDKFAMRKRQRTASFVSPGSSQMEGMGLYSGRGAYGVRKFGRDFKSIVPKSIRRQMEQSLIQGLSEGMSGQGLYSGRGAYNALIDGGRASMSYSSDNDETQSICISHTEYLQDVFGAGSSSFTVEGWALNPGLVDNFPWLSQIAANYEEYEFIQLLFHFKSTVDASAINNTNGATGTIIMATNYNPSAPNFPNKEVMMQYHGANSGRVVEDHTHGVECDPEKNAGSAQKYVRSNPVIVNQDPKTFDLGKFQIGQVNIPDAFKNQQIGELWVTYTVKLTKPRLFAALGGLSLENRWVSANTATYTPGTASIDTSTEGIGMLGSGAGNGTFAIGNATTSNTWTPTTAGGTLNGWRPLVAINSMQQNGMNIKVEQIVQAGISTTTNCFVGLQFTFPDFLTGVFEIQVLAEGTTMTLVNNQIYPAYFGSVTAYNDLYGTTTNASAGLPSSNGACVSLGVALMAIQRVAIAPIVQGADNVVQLTFLLKNSAPSDAVYKGCQVIIRQCSGYLAQSSDVQVPLYVNKVGVVQGTPYVVG